MSRIREYWRLEWESMKAWNKILAWMLFAVALTPLLSLFGGVVLAWGWWDEEAWPVTRDYWREWWSIGKRQRALNTPAPKEADRG